MGVYAIRPRALSSSALMGLGASSSASVLNTSHAITARARKSGAGGIAARPSATIVAATTPTATVARNAAGQGRRWPRRTAGVSATDARNALAMSDGNGGTPTSGSATLSDAKIDTTKKTYPSHGRGWTTARYHGSKVARSARVTSNARNAAFREVSVVAAQYAASTKRRSDFRSEPSSARMSTKTAKSSQRSRR